jgi:aminoglycoside phosphotransferase (APT) family kinase protein
MAASGLRPADLLLARRQPELPRVTAHGDFHAGNILCEADGPWIIDWELAAPRPLGYDLLSLWPTLADPFDRRLVLEAALEQAGPEHHTEILRLRFALLVRALAAVVGAPRGFGGVGPPASELRKLLADARREAAG